MKDIQCIFCKYKNDEDRCREAVFDFDYHCPTLSNIFYGKIIKLPIIKQIYNVCDRINDYFVCKKYDDYYIDEYETKDMKFIWGVKSWDDLTGADACLYTMNDIDITYDKSRKVYMLGVETAYLFKTYGDECQYLRDCLNAFTKYMDDNGLNKNEPYRLWMSNPCTNMEAETIEELYTNFKIFVDGFCNLDIEADMQRH